MKTLQKELLVIALREEDCSNPHPGKRLALTFSDGRVLALDFSLARHAPWAPAVGVLDMITLRSGVRGRVLCVVVRGSQLTSGIAPYFFWCSLRRVAQNELLPYLTRADRAIRKGWVKGAYPYIQEMVLEARRRIFEALEAGTMPDYTEDS